MWMCVRRMGESSDFNVALLTVTGIGETGRLDRDVQGPRKILHSSLRSFMRLGLFRAAAIAPQRVRRKGCSRHTSKGEEQLSISSITFGPCDRGLTRKKTRSVELPSPKRQMITSHLQYQT